MITVLSMWHNFGVPHCHMIPNYSKSQTVFYLHSMFFLRIYLNFKYIYFIFVNTIVESIKSGH